MRTEARAPISNRESSVRDNGRERERGTRRALSPLDLVTFVEGDAANFPYFNVSLSLSLSLYHLYEKFLRLFTAEKKSRETIEGQEDVRTITDPHFFTLCLKTTHVKILTNFRCLSRIFIDARHYTYETQYLTNYMRRM